MTGRNVGTMMSTMGKQEQRALDKSKVCDFIFAEFFVVKQNVPGQLPCSDQVSSVGAEGPLYAAFNRMHEG
jgi:hypothetical protein